MKAAARIHLPALFLLMTLVARGGEPGSLSGVIRDGQGLPIEGAQITLSSGESSPLSTTSDAKGGYHFSALPAGSYRLLGSLSGFESGQSDVITISRATASVTVDLTLSRHAARPQFESAGVRGLIDPGGYSASSNAAAASGLIKGIADIKRTGNDADRISAPCSLEPALKKAVEEKPASAEANRKLAEFYLAHGQADRATPILEHARSLDQGDQATLEKLAEAYLEVGQFASALNLLTPLTGAHDRPELERLLARANEGSGKFKEASQDYQLAADQAPTEENLFGVGYEFILAGLPKEAERAFEAGVKRYPSSQQLLIGTGSAQFLQGHASESVQTLLRAVELNPADPRPYPFLAAAAGISSAEAVRVRGAFEQFLSAVPNNPRASYYVALNLLHQGAADGANDQRIEGLLKRTLVLDPELADAHYQLGVLYARRGDYQHARQELENTVRLSPNLQEAHYRLAMAYRQTGRADLAAKELERFHQEQDSSRTAGIDQFISVFATPALGMSHESLCPGDSP